MSITLRKAIELLDLDLLETGEHKLPDLRSAQRLGIQAMRKWQELREGRAGVIDPLLPGEKQDPPCQN